MGNNLEIDENERGIGEGSGLLVWGAREVARRHAATGVVADVVAAGRMGFRMGEIVVDERIPPISEAGDEKITPLPEVAVHHPRVLILALLLQHLRSIVEVADTMIARHQEEEGQKVLPEDVKRVLYDGVTMRALRDDVTMSPPHDVVTMKALPHGVVVAEEARVVEEMTTDEVEMASPVEGGVDTAV